VAVTAADGFAGGVSAGLGEMATNGVSSGAAVVASDPHALANSATAHKICALLIESP